MNKKSGVFIFLVGLYVLSLFVGGETKSASVEKENLSPSSHGEDLTVYFFTGNGCPHCAKVEPFIAVMEQRYPIQLHKFDIYIDRSNLPLLDDYSSRHGIPLEERGIPAVFTSDTYLIGDTPILDGLEQAVKKSLKASSPPDQDLDVKNLESADPVVPSAVSNLPIITVTVSALVDAISPCSIAILVFLIGARVLVADQRKRALKVGLTFCLSVFIAYFLFGLGLLTVLQVSGVSNTFGLLAGLVALMSGTFYIKDVFWHGRGGFVMEVPRSLKPLLMKMLRGVTSPFGAFVMGFVAVCFELPCTGGPYLFILGQLANSATRLQAVPLLLYHNFIFVLPLLMISLLLYSDLFSIEKVREWNGKNKRLLRLVGGVAMIALGVLSIPISPMLQLTYLSLLVFKVASPPVLVFVFFYLVVSSVKGRNLGSKLAWLPKGTILLCLLVTAGFVAQKPVTFTFAAEDELPVADAGPDQTVLLGETVAFDGSGSYDLDGIIISYAWDFGDPFDPTTGTGVNPTHTYSQSDVYVVTLTVTDDAGWESRDTMTVVVEDEIVMLELNYESGSLFLLDVYKKYGFAPDRRIQPESGYQVQVISKSEKILYAFTFDVPNTLMWDYPEGDILTGGSIELDETDFALSIPYFESAEQVDVYYPNGILALSVNIENIPEKGGSNCQTMVNNGSSDNLLDIVFVGDGFTTAQLPQFAAEVGRHNTTLLSVPPFSNHSSNINIHWVNESRNLGCYYGYMGIPRLIRCNTTAVLSLASQCPADEIVVILASNTYGGSGILGYGDVTSYAVSYNGTDWSLAVANPADWSGDRVTVHELGHSFGNLHDEYNYTTPLSGPPTGPNCDANPTCPTWSAWNPGCHPGCSNTNWYRGDNTGGDLMMTLTNLTFGPVCTRALNRTLNNYPRVACGGSTPCQYGDLLTQSRTLNSSDFTRPYTAGDGLEIGRPGITLDCNGRPMIGSGALGSTGIKNVWFNNVTIKNCNVSDFYNGIHVKRVSNNVLRNNTIYSTRGVLGSGIWVETSTWNNMTINNASSYKWGIAFDINSDNNRAMGNTLSSCQRGIELYNSSRNAISNNIVNNNTLYGIYVNNGSSNNTLTRNTADFNSQHGLYISDSAAIGNTVNNCRFCFNNQTGGMNFDIFDADSNVGDYNQCNTTRNWNDTSAAVGCTYRCVSGTSVFTSSTLGVNVTLASGAPVTALIANVTNAAVVANLTGAVGPRFASIALFANISTKCPPIDWAYIQLYYSESRLIVDESTLMMYYWNPSIFNWTLIPDSGVNTEANYVWANVTHLSIFTGIGELAHATIDVDPDTLNLKSQGQWITAYIQLPEGHNPEDIDAATILLNHTVSPILDPRYDFVTNASKYLVDHNEDGILERMVKFDTAQVISLIKDHLAENGWKFCNATVTVTGNLAGGMEFEGSDIIKVIVGDVNGDNAVNIFDLTEVAVAYGSFENDPLYDWYVDLNEDNMIDLRDLAIVTTNYGRS